MRILLLTQWFDPEPTFKGLLFARELVARGHEVEVLTGFPNYPGGDVYPGYRIRPWRRERIDGISILRVALYPSHDKSAAGRILNYLSFAFSASLLGTALIAKPDVIYVYHPPATVGFAAVVIGFLRKVPFVYDIQDLWPDTVAVSGMLSNRAAISMLDKCCKFVYRRAWHIVALSPGLKDKLLERGVAPEKVDVIYNWCDESAMKPGRAEAELASNLGLSGCFNVMFAGTMGTAQALDSVLDAAALCRPTHPKVQFVFVGGGVDRGRLEKKAADLALSNVRFLPRQPMRAMGAILGLADVLLVHLRSDPLFSITIPSKTQAYMASGKPMLMAVRGDAAQLLSQSGGGLVCEPEDPAGIAAAVARFAAMSPAERLRIGEAGRKFYDGQLSLKAGVTRFEAIFCGVRASALPSGFAPALSLYQRFGKRLFDLVLTAALLILLSPLMLIVGLCARRLIGKPVFFRQVRPGYHEQLFTIFKFRTMLDLKDSRGRPLPDGQRLRRFGAFLRRTSLDELPEFWNVLKGDMSLVGPRPLLPEYLPRYSSAQRRRHEVKPGITGLAQVKGRNSLSWEEKFAWDVYYVDRCSLGLDLRILWMTFASVMKRKGISQDGQATAAPFLGSEREPLRREVS